MFLWSIRFVVPLLAMLCCWPVLSQSQSTPKPKSRVLVIGVNGMEWDILRPLLMKGELPNLAKVIQNGVHGKLKTTSAPNCPRIYSTLFTSPNPESMA